VRQNSSLYYTPSESLIFTRIFYHGLPGLHGWETHQVLSVSSGSSVVQLLWLRLAALWSFPSDFCLSVYMGKIYRAVHWVDYTARTAGPIFSLAPRRRSGERVGVRGCLLPPILRAPQYIWDSALSPIPRVGGASRLRASLEPRGERLRAADWAGLWRMHDKIPFLRLLGVEPAHASALPES
jgi:hypothetical protein